MMGELAYVESVLDFTNLVTSAFGSVFTVTSSCKKNLLSCLQGVLFCCYIPMNSWENMVPMAPHSLAGLQQECTRTSLYALLGP